MRSPLQVTVLVELKARFDEARNVGYAQRLEDAGCNVAYGLIGLKAHCKLMLVGYNFKFGADARVFATQGSSACRMVV